MRLDHEVELRFLQFTQSLLAGQFPGPPGARLEPFEIGLWRRDGQVLVRLGLQDQVAKAVVGFLARQGGATPERYAYRGRRIRAALLGRPLVEVLSPLGFGAASARLLVQAHDEALAGAGIEFPEPATLGDRLVFHLVARALRDGLPAGLARASPLTALGLLGPASAGEAVKAMCGREPEALVLRALGTTLARGWVRRLASWLGQPPDKQLAHLADASGILEAFRAGGAATGRLSLLVPIPRAWRMLFAEVLPPEDLLGRAAKGAQSFRTVRDQEAYLGALAGLFGTAGWLTAEADRIQQTPFVEREEEEKLFHEEIQAGLRPCLEAAVALHRALGRRLG